MVYNIKSESQYKKLRSKEDKHMKAFKVYRTKTKRNWINEKEAKKYSVPEGLSNEQKSKVEVYEYQNKPLKPKEKYFAYLSSDGNRIETFMGDKIADITYLKENKNNYSYISSHSKKYSFEGKDINGKKIKGRAYADKGGYVRFYVTN